ncbi:YciI family protein [Peristeroidobacter soli]|uniref:YciI family protein n=1 Tax=Peristeroidobacter soli TaxID=2497877 RepID=UPI00101C9E10|nr:YciI family protein [Peristeroidobacter soli]
MKFIGVCYYDLEGFAKLQPGDFQKIGELCAPHDARLKASGKVSLIGSLALPNEFRTVRAGKSGVTEQAGPYEQTKEPWGAFFIVEAQNMDEAVRIARLHPGTHLGEIFGGGIEVRPIESLEQLSA